MGRKKDKRKSEGSESDTSGSSNGVSRKSEPSSAKKARKVDPEEEERKLRKKIMGKLTKIEDHEAFIVYETEQVNILKAEYLTKFKKDFEDDEIEDYSGFTSKCNKRAQHENENTKFPVGGKICKVCSNRTKSFFSRDDQVLLCGVCLDAIRTNNLAETDSNYKQKQCICPQQLLGKGEPDWRIVDCMRCKLAMIKKLYPTLYNANNLLPAEPPVYTTPGHFGHLMDLINVRRDNYTNKPAPGVNTVALLVTVMDINQIHDRTVNDKLVKGERVIGPVLLKVEFDNCRLDSPFGLQTMSHLRNNHRIALGSCASSTTVNADLIHVDTELIQWSPTEPKHAATAFNCHKMVHYMLNPLLNSNQIFQTRVPKLTMQSKYITLDGLNVYMNKRQVQSIGWRVKETPTDELKGPKILNRGGRVKHRMCTELESTASDNYVANIYGYFVKKGGIIYANIGSHFGPHPRQHKSGSSTSLAKFLFKNKADVEYFSTVLVHLKKNDTEHKLIYEGQVQTIFKLAELNGITLDQLHLPFPDSGASDNWTNLDKKKLPKLPIQLLNDTIHGAHMSWDEFQFFLNLPKVFFGMEFGYPDFYKWGNDPFRFTIEPKDSSMELEEEPHQN